MPVPRTLLTWSGVTALLAGAVVPALADAPQRNTTVRAADAPARKDTAAGEAAHGPHQPHRPGPRAAKNVILLIGDGMGDSEITMARNYTVGAAGRLHMDAFPETGAYTTYSVDERGRPEYVTDSAAGASGFATGHKTVNGRISKTPGTDEPVPTLLELAQRAGYATGSVTTASVTDATPAAMAAHVRDRSCQGPADMARCPGDTLAAGGAGSIAEQSVNLGVDVLLGGGRERFEQTVTEGPFRGGTVVEQAEKRGHRVLTDPADLARTDASRPVLGLFAADTLPQEWQGKPAAPGGTDPQRCRARQDKAAAGSLAQQTRQALRLLQEKRGKGFLLQVEGAQIDYAAHDADPCGQIGETAAFDRAVKVAQDFAARDQDTLVVVTADHGHSGQLVSSGAEPPGLSATLVTDEGREMRVSYSTSAEPGIQEHTGTQVRIAAQGPYAHRVRGVTDQTELFTTVRTALGLGR